VGRSTRRVAVVMAAAVALSAGLVAPAWGASPNPGAQIIGEDPAEPAAYPFMAAILNHTIEGNDYQKQFCGGSLVDDEWVLTPAHCVEGDSPASLAVAVGRTTLTSNDGQRRAVVQVVVHPSFGQPTALSNDAALLRLAAPVTSIVPLRLAGAADDRFEVDGTILTVIGWGTVDPPTPTACTRSTSRP